MHVQLYISQKGDLCSPGSFRLGPIRWWVRARCHGRSLSFKRPTTFMTRRDSLFARSSSSAPVSSSGDRYAPKRLWSRT